MPRHDLFVISLLCIFFTSCGLERSEKSLRESVGKYGELLVVVDTALENAETGRILEKIFLAEVEGLPQPEPMFRMNTVSHYGFSGSILEVARNILLINVGSNYSAGIEILEEVWANDQLVIEIRAKNSEIVNQILKKNSLSLQEYFNQREIDRLQKQFQISPKEDLSDSLLEAHGISLLIPPAYFLMQSRDSDFWIKKEQSIGQHQVIQGLMVYYYPYRSDSSFTAEEMIEMRDKYTKGYIHGATDSSYMQVYEKYIPHMDTVSIEGMYAVEYRGLWDMKNDFMGGPFLHYTVLDEKNQRIINLDAFVYAPKFNKREYIRELEAILKSLKVQ